MTQSNTTLDKDICEEMMVHSLFYTHPDLKNIALIADDNSGFTREILKHPSIHSIWLEKHAALEIHDNRINVFADGLENWLGHMPDTTLDGVIIADSKTLTHADYQRFFSILKTDGMFVQQAQSLFNTEQIRTIYQSLHQCGFQDLQVMNFPVPSGSRTAVMAIKHGTFKRIREKDIYNKSFATRFYNFDMHKAALALPEFVREELAV